MFLKRKLKSSVVNTFQSFFSVFKQSTCFQHFYTKNKKKKNLLSFFHLCKFYGQKSRQQRASKQAVAGNNNTNNNQNANEKKEKRAQKKIVSFCVKYVCVCVWSTALNG